MKEKKEKANTNYQLRNIRGVITTDHTEIRRTIRKNYEKLYTNKFKNLDE